MLRLVVLLIVAVLPFSSEAREGMWLPMLIDDFNIGEMQEMGFKLSAADVYAVNAASMKDAVVRFGNGCTGGVISAEGLIITNNHCANSAIQKLSSIENDYLTAGFWASSREEELPNEGLTVSILRSMKDVTALVLSGVNDSIRESARQRIIASNIDSISNNAVKDLHYQAVVEPFYSGNRYYLFVYEVFKDIRLVGAPPAGIGDFGGESDNWMWPRHTGDFALFRIYADESNRAADFSPTNVPYKPAHYFPVSLEGVEEGDFAMVLGFPAKTSQYVPSYHVSMLADLVYPKMIELRDAKLDIMDRHIVQDQKIRLQYAAKHSAVANSFKRWKGEIRGLKMLGGVDMKQQYEAGFNTWLNSDSMRIVSYGNILSEYSKLYKALSKYRLAHDYMLELIGYTGIETLKFAGSFERLATLVDAEEVDEDAVEMEKLHLREQAEKHFKDFSRAIDMEICISMFEMMEMDLPQEFRPSFLSTIKNQYKGDYSSFVKALFDNTLFDKHNDVSKFIDKFDKRKVKELKADPAFAIYTDMRNIYYKDINTRYIRINSRIDSLNRVYINALMEYDKERHFYPDANSTLRLSYGEVMGYEPSDGIVYSYFTTLDGVIEKEDPDNYDYRVPEKLKELYHAGDFGQYGMGGTVPVCFVSTNHTTGGNSGSPVLNDRGELIGLNFDRAWDGIMSDMIFNPHLSRNISVNMRYVLFIIDKYAGSAYLFDEMTIVGD